MTVPSIPIESAAARSTPSSTAALPRTMFPPPITIASSTPPPTPSWISSARRPSAAASIAWPALPARTSPLSLRRTRRGACSTGSVLPDPELGESAHHDVFAELRDRLIQKVLHPAFRISDVGLLEGQDF